MLDLGESDTRSAFRRAFNDIGTALLDAFEEYAEAAFASHANSDKRRSRARK